VIVYSAVGLYLRSIESEIEYAQPQPLLSHEEAAKRAAVAGLVPWTNTTPGAEGPQGFVPPHFGDPAPRGTVVLFHGNGDPAWSSADRIAPFSQRGFRVFFYEYPGFGGRPGTPSEKAIVPDARAVVKALAQEGYGPIYVWGESIGTGIASAVCADDSLPIQGLGLCCPWDNIANVGLSYYPWLPVRAFMVDTYDSVANLQHFQHPICITYGDQDDTIIPALSKNLYAHLNQPKKIILMKGYGHGDWPSDATVPWWDEALNFIAPPASGSKN
jgi:pimeloyl-ACP methyl ester carboxylesterase